MDERAFEMAQEREEAERAAAIERRVRYAGVSREHCAECDDPIPAKRRNAIPGVQCCIECQALKERP
ncbi:transcriptional regulator, TraR/DksA family [Halopseudomonas litoralis]|uniref:Transcriptional regulator, TraR/DksA family n=1 Tax=Halopseudomonas litoralis TaxID=797277 RepID=A0A1H1NUQ0_9GAMM|nr:TraR/DksA C4-type zinc finger protein [Halopseudomonas litoralis]SDS02696.1 transcriptional regulator, TraR/DksA family [Halopseudomonas litoralis]